jgi:hypothetical protein
MGWSGCTLLEVMCNYRNPTLLIGSSVQHCSRYILWKLWMKVMGCQILLRVLKLEMKMVDFLCTMHAHEVMTT